MATHPTRLIIDPPQPGSWNMAVDQALLRSANHRGAPTLRLYRWAPATLSLGYFQKFDERKSHASSAHCPVVRRASGGGAILHDQEWTYSLTVPADQRLSRNHEQLVRVVHQALIDALRDHGIVAEFYDGGSAGELPSSSVNAELKAEEAGSASDPTAAPFLCFKRRAQSDLVVQGHKICGSAQRRVEGAILQHGSLLLRRSSAAPELPGILDVSDKAIDFEKGSEFIAAWLEYMGKHLQAAIQTAGLNAQESVLAKKIEVERFAQLKWTRRR